MNNIRILIILFTVISGFFLLPEGYASTSELFSPPFLKDRLPSSTVAYVRIPNIWGVIGAPSGNGLDRVVTSPSAVKAMASINKDLQQNLVSKLPQDLRYPLELFSKHMISPLEAGLISGKDPRVPFPNLLLSFKTDIHDPEVMKKLINSMASSPSIAVAAPLSDKGVAVVMASNFPMYIKHDKQTGVVTIMSGMMLDLVTFTNTLAMLNDPGSKLPDMGESKVDESGQGLFIWVNGKLLMPMLMRSMAPEDLADFKKAGIDQIESIVLGLGTADTKNRLLFEVSMPETGFKQLIPVVRNSSDISSVGEPDYVGLFFLPSGERLKKLVDQLGQYSSEPELASKFQQFEQKMAKEYGVSVTDLLSAYGPEAYMFSDDAGEFVALKVRNPAQHRTILSKIRKLDGAGYQKREHKGRTYHSLVLPPRDLLESDEARAFLPPEEAWLAEVPFMGRTRLFWLEEQGYLVIASVPQYLIDRSNMGAGQSIVSWLKNRQKVDVSHSALLGTFRIDNTPRYIYTAYLSMLLYLSDISNSNIDPFSFPTARELDLPEDGVFGVQMNVDAGSLSMLITSEATPIEGLMANNGMATVAVAGVLAAIAIPAYQDYKHRAEMSQVMYQLMPYQKFVAEIMVKKGQYPTEAEIREYISSAEKYPQMEVSIEPGRGVISVVFPQGDFAGEQIELIPTDNQGDLEWKCESDGLYKHLPASCR